MGNRGLPLENVPGAQVAPRPVKGVGMEGMGVGMVE